MPHMMHVTYMFYCINHPRYDIYCTYWKSPMQRYIYIYACMIIICAYTGVNSACIYDFMNALNGLYTCMYTYMMCVYMCICMHVYTLVYIYMYIYIYLYIYVYMCIYVYIYVYMCIYVYICVYIPTLSGT